MPIDKDNDSTSPAIGENETTLQQEGDSTDLTKKGTKRLIAKSRHSARVETAKQKLSATYHKNKAKEKKAEKASKAMVAPTKEEREEEFLERMQYMELDDLYQKREFQSAMVEIITKERGSTKYTAHDRMAAVLAYVVTGSTFQAADATGIPVQTIKAWKSDSSWWPQALEYARNAQKESLVSKWAQIQNKAHENLMDRLLNGDEKVDLRTGMQYRIKVSARDLMYIAEKSQDKGMILRGEATNISEKRQTQDSILQDIAKKLEKAVAGMDAKVIDGIVIKDSKKGK